LTNGAVLYNRLTAEWQHGSSTVSEVGSIQLEYQLLSRLTSNSIYAERVNKVNEVIHQLNRPLLSQFINVDSGQLSTDVGIVVTFGSRVDSIYEYFLKQHILSNQSDSTLLPYNMYINSMNAMMDELLSESHPYKFRFVAELIGGQRNGKFDHLVCFLPGLLALGVESNAVQDEKIREQHIQVASDLMDTCIAFYIASPTGLSPEIILFRADDEHDFVIDNGAAHNLLRPETVESLFIMYRATHDNYFREVGWQIFQSFVRYGRVSTGGYSSIVDVRVQSSDASNKRDHMESFWIAETLKYFYLLFSDDNIIPLNYFVMNTEAHPLPIDRGGTKIIAPKAADVLPAVAPMQQL